MKRLWPENSTQVCLRTIGFALNWDVTGPTVVRGPWFLLASSLRRLHLVIWRHFSHLACNNPREACSRRRRCQRSCSYSLSTWPGAGSRIGHIHSWHSVSMTVTLWGEWGVGACQPMACKTPLSSSGSSWTSVQKSQAWTDRCSSSS